MTELLNYKKDRIKLKNIIQLVIFNLLIIFGMILAAFSISPDIYNFLDRGMIEIAISFSIALGFFLGCFSMCIIGSWISFYKYFKQKVCKSCENRNGTKALYCDKCGIKIE